jgi:hypothetical protein
MATAAETQQVSMQLDRIHVPGNVRSLDIEHVQALAGSIRLQAAGSSSSSPGFTASPPRHNWV